MVVQNVVKKETNMFNWIKSFFKKTKQNSDVVIDNTAISNTNIQQPVTVSLEAPVPVSVHEPVITKALPKKPNRSNKPRKQSNKKVKR